MVRARAPNFVAPRQCPGSPTTRRQACATRHGRAPGWRATRRRSWTPSERVSTKKFLAWRDLHLETVWRAIEPALSPRWLRQLRSLRSGCEARFLRVGTDGWNGSRGTGNDDRPGAIGLSTRTSRRPRYDPREGDRDAAAGLALLGIWGRHKKADRAAQQEARRRLHQTLFPCDSAVLESKGERDWKAPRRRLVHLTPNKARGHAGPYGSNEVPASAPRSHATDCRWDRFGPSGRTVIPVRHSSAPCASEALQ